ncbi:GPP34 family phosphoprotein [Oceanobacillus sp. CFH 90083]|uniref:GPP34 family phosphoprotein n=1 Tax=Oceanobacillus sp. CFH 90083 TaxID=2592336 RepID=UPI00128CE2D0|nr:GPP34 family phosphoprotein [Oceanobacillus sp. CFH 90083]
MEEQVKLHHSKLKVIPTEVDDPLLKETMEMMQQKSEKTLKYWVSALKHSHKNIASKIATKLDQAGVGNMEEKRILSIFPSYTYTFNQVDFIRRMQKSKKQELLEKEEERTIVLISLVHVSSLLRIVFPDRKESGRKTN